MRYVIIVFYSIVLYANDVDAVALIVKDIENLRVEYNKLQEKSNKFEKQNKVLENTLKNKELIIKNLHTKVNILEKKFKNTHSDVLPSKNTEINIEKIIPTTFRLLSKANVYDSVDGVKISTWNANKSFTSDTQTDNWVKVTGYFVAKKWQRPGKELWIKKDNITERLSK